VDILKCLLLKYSRELLMTANKKIIFSLLFITLLSIVVVFTNKVNAVTDTTQIIDNSGVTPLPIIETSPNVKTGPSNETDAGNEPTVPTSNSTSDQQQTGSTNVTNSTTLSSPAPRRSSINRPATPPQATNTATPTVLGETDNNKVTAPTSSPVIASTNNTAKSYKFYKKAWFYYGLIAFIALVTILFFVLYRQRQVASN
jgi:hypothetical protein